MTPSAFSPARTPLVPGTTHAVVPFIGREAVVREALLRLGAGSGTVLTGPSGIGKSRTLAVIADRAEQAGTPVGRITATQSFAAVPFGAFLGLLPMDTTMRIGREDPLGRAAIVRAAVLSLGLRAVAVDDAHLLDPPSAALLADLVRTGTALIAVVDPAATAPDAVYVLPEVARAAVEELLPFDQAECAALTETVLGAPLDTGTARTLYQASTGNPLVLRELVDGCVRSGVLKRSGCLWTLTAPVPAPARLVELVRARLAELDVATRVWVERVAVAESVPADIGITLADVASADRAEAAGWVTLDEDLSAYRIAHPLTRGAVLEATGTRSRHDALRALADAAAALDRPLTDGERPALARWHLDLGDPLPAADALELARATALTQPELAERFLRAALAANDGAPVRIRLAEHLLRTGRMDEAEQLLDGVVPDPDDVTTAVAAAGTRGLVTGLGARRSGEALAEVDAALERWPGTPLLLAVRVALLLAETRLQEATEVAETLSAQEAPGFAAVFGGLHRVLALTLRGDEAAALAAAMRLRPIAEESVRDVPEGPMFLEWLAGFVPWTTALDVAAGVAVGQREYERTLHAGLHPARAQFAHLLGRCRLLQGDADQAVQLLREAEVTPCFWRDSRLPVIVADLVGALVMAGDLATAEAALARLEAMPRTPEQESDRDLAVAALHAGRGDLTRAARIAAGVAERAGARGATVEAFDARHLGVRYGDLAAAAALAADTTLPGDVRDLQRHHAKALLAHDLAALDLVADAYWAADLRLFAVEAAALAARWRVDEEGPTAVAPASERLLRWTMTLPSLVDPLADTLPLAGLTAREAEIVRLAATGLPDRAIAAELGISTRTAQTHLQRAFNKLGVHRRRDLRNLLPGQNAGR